MSKDQNLSALEAWILARITNGYELQDLPYGLSNRIEALARQMLSINYKDREFLLKRNLSSKEAQDVFAVDTESTQPLPPTDSDELWTIIPARDLKHLPPMRWIIPGEIMEEGLTVIYGESGAGKSFIGLDYALRVAQNQQAVYIPTEGEAGYAKRVAAWCQHHHATEGKLFFIFGGISLYDQALFEKLLTDLARLKPKLVIVDTLAMALAGGDENSTRDMGILLRACRRIIRALGASVALVHHVNKGGIVERGSGALRGNADIMIKVSPADDQVLVECAKTKDEKPFDSRYMFLLPVQTDEGESLVPVPAEQVKRDTSILSHTQVKLLDALALEVNRDGVTVRDLETQTGVSLATVVRTLSNLMHKELVHKPFGSYAITEAGLKAIGKVDPSDPPSDPSLIHQNQQNLADDPLDPPDPSISTKNADPSAAKNSGSSGSSLNDVDQAGSSGSTDQPGLFPEGAVARKRQPSHYTYGG